MIGHVDKVINLVDPLIRWFFRYFLGNYIDLENLDFSKLFEKGLCNLKIDHTKLNATLLKDCPLLVEKCVVGKMSVKINLKEKTVKLVVEALEIGLFVNEDVVGFETARKASESKVNSMDQQIPSSLQSGFISNFLRSYAIDVSFLNSSVSVRPTRPTCPSERFELVLGEMTISKLADPLSSNSNSPMHYQLKTQIRNLSLFLVPKEPDLAEESFVDISNTHTHNSLIFHLFETLNIDANFLIKDETLTFTLNGKIPKIVLLVSPSLIAQATLFQYKLENFTNSFLIQDEANFETIAQSENSIHYSAVKFNLEEKFESFINRINCSMGESPLDESHNIDTSNIYRSFGLESAKAQVELTIGRVVVILYDPIDWDTEVGVDRITDELDEGFVSFFPFESSQIAFNNCSIRYNKSDMTSTIDNFSMKTFKLTKGIKAESIDRTLNTSSMMHSFNETLFEAFPIFEFTYNEDSFTGNVIIEESEDFILNEENVSAYSRKESAEFTAISQLKKNSLEVSYKMPRKQVLKFKLTKNHLIVAFETFKIQADTFLDFLDHFLARTNDNLTKSVALFKAMTRSDIYTTIEREQFFDNYVKFIDASKIEKLSLLHETIKSKKMLLFSGDLVLSVIADQISFLSSLPLLPKLLEIKKLSFSTRNAKKKYSKILKIKEIALANILFLRDIKGNSKNFSEENMRNDFEIKIQKADLKTGNHLASFASKKLFNVIHFFNSKLNSLSKSIDKIGLLMPQLRGSYELISDKINFNELLSKIILKSFPDIKVFDIVTFDLEQFELSIVDNNVANFVNVNNQFKENEQKLKSLNIISEQSILPAEIITGLQLVYITLKEFSVRFAIDSQESAFDIKSIFCKLMEHQSNIFELYVYDMKASSDTKASVFVNKVKCDLNFSYRLINIFTTYIHQNVILPLKRIIDDFPSVSKPSNQNDKNPAKSSAPPFDLNLCVNEFDLSCQQLISGVRMYLKKMELGKDHLQVDEVCFWKLSANESIMNDKLLEIKGVKLSHLSQLSVNEIQAWIKKEYILVMKDFVNQLKETYQNIVKKLSESVNDLCNKSIAISQVIEKDASIYQSTVSTLTQSKIEYKQIGNYEVVSEKWELFDNFNKIFNKGHNHTSFNLLKSMKTKFLSGEGISLEDEHTVQINIIRIYFIEDEVRQKISIFFENMYGCLSKKVWIAVLGRFYVGMETPTNNFVLLENSNSDFSLKFYGEIIQENILSFYLKSDNYSLYGDSEMWEAIDNRLKVLLKEFGNSHEADEADEFFAEDKFASESDINLHEAVIEGFNITLKLSILSRPLIMEINPTYSLELAQDLVSFDKFGDKVLENFLGSVQHFCRSLAPHQAVKIISFLMWRVLKFIILKRNFKKVNTSIYRLLKNKLNKVFIR
jgi:hypothetical protein